mgnify:CR=1 FL=1
MAVPHPAEHEGLIRIFSAAQRIGALGTQPVKDMISHACAFADALPQSVRTCVDLGSGAGVPGLVIAIARPEIRLTLDTTKISKGLHIRRAGENAPKGSTVLDPGIEINGAHKATMANFGCSIIDTYRPVRVTILTTGNEVGNFQQNV